MNAQYKAVPYCRSSKYRLICVTQSGNIINYCDTLGSYSPIQYPIKCRNYSRMTFVMHFNLPSNWDASRNLGSARNAYALGFK